MSKKAASAVFFVWGESKTHSRYDVDKEDEHDIR